MPENPRLCLGCYEFHPLQKNFRCKGCNAAAQHNSEQGNSEQGDSRALSAVTGPSHSLTESPVVMQDRTAPALPVQLDMQAALRTQIYDQFFQSHCPTGSVTEVNRAKSIGFLACIGTTASPPNLVRIAIDALCYAYLGSTKQDQRLVRTSQQLYGQVLGCIRQVLGSSHTHIGERGREIILSIMIISLYDDCIPVQQRNANTYMTHLWGAHHYLNAIPPDQFKLTEHLDQNLVRGVFQNAFWLGLARRKGLSDGHSSWPDVHTVLFPSEAPYTVLKALPGLLERTDLALQGDFLGEQVSLESIFKDLDDIRETMVQKSQGSSAKLRSQMIRAIDLIFDPKIEEHKFISRSLTVTSFYSFDSANEVVIHACRAMILLLIECTLLRILHFGHKSQLSGYCFQRRHVADIKRDATSWADELCRCVYQVSQLNSLAYIDFSILFMDLAANFFYETDDPFKNIWCGTCSHAARARLKRQQCCQPQTLCRVGDLPVGICAAGSYRNSKISTAESRQPYHCPVVRPTAAVVSALPHSDNH